MKMIFAVAACTVSALGTCVVGAAEKTVTQDARSGQRATELIDALAHGQFAAVAAGFDLRMRDALPADKLAATWKTITQQAGELQHCGAAAVTRKDSLDVVLLPCAFANANLDARIVYDAEGKVAGLFFVPGSAVAATSTATTSTNDHAGSTDQALSVPSPLGPLPGTFTLPAGESLFPAVLLLAGSGPQDRDESIGPNKPLLDLARGLAEHGIASFRYDKRTYIYGTKMAGESITVDDEVTDDAVSALAQLARQPHIDPTRIFVLGHSLGALMAPRIAARYPQAAGMILLAAPVAFNLDVVLRQTRYIAGVQGASPEQLQQATAPIVSARDAIAHADPAHPPAGQFFHAPASYWLSLRDYRPIAVAGQLKQPMLVLQGGSDYQVTPNDDFARWQVAFAHVTRVTLREYPGLSHLFMPAGNPPSPTDYAKPGHVDARVIADIAQWITASLHSGVNSTSP
jgi:uncharacterized protein